MRALLERGAVGEGDAPALDREEAFAEQAARSQEPAVTAFVLSDGRSWAVLTTERTHPVDAAVLHSTLLPAWHIADEIQKGKRSKAKATTEDAAGGKGVGGWHPQFTHSQSAVG